MQRASMPNVKTSLPAVHLLARMAGLLSWRPPTEGIAAMGTQQQITYAPLTDTHHDDSSPTVTLHSQQAFQVIANKIREGSTT